MQLGTADTHLLRQHLHIEVAVRQVLVDGLHDAFHQHLIIAFHLNDFQLVGLLLCTRELALQAEAALNQVLNDHVQLLHDEGLGQEGIGTALQALQTVGHVGFRRQHHHWQMREVEIRLDHAQHGEAIHLRHHHIAHHSVVFVGEQFLHGLLAIGANAEFVVTA